MIKVGELYERVSDNCFLGLNKKDRILILQTEPVKISGNFRVIKVMTQDMRILKLFPFDENSGIWKKISVDETSFK